jgi:soluble lytic murein transglycosylase-like protein
MAAAVLSTSLSCSLIMDPISVAVPQTTVGQGPAIDAVAGPSMIDWVEAQFHRYHTGLAPFEVRQVSKVIVEESRFHGIEVQLILAVIRTESAFNNFAVSPVGAMGLMQVMPFTGQEVATWLDADWRGKRTLFEPVTNVRIGVAYLAWLYERYDSRWERALAAYNWGPHSIDGRLRRGRALPAAYVNKVLSDRRVFAGRLRP